MGDADVRSASSVLWNLIFSATGYRKHEISVLRERNAKDCDLAELVTDDINFVDAGAVMTLRGKFQEYLHTLRKLKVENAYRTERKFKPKNYVEDTRYHVLREREVEQRVTPASIAASFTRVDLSKRKIDVVESDIEELAKVEELLLSQNRLKELAFLPRSVRLVSAAGNSITRVSSLALKSCSKLVFLSLACNGLERIDFLLDSPALQVVDLSYNDLFEMDHVVSVLSAHPTICEVTLTGNSVYLQPHYRRALVENAPHLRVIDGVPLTEEEAESAGKQPRLTPDELAAPGQLHLKLISLQGLPTLLPRAIHTPGAEEGAAGRSGKGPQKAAPKEKGKPGAKEPEVAAQQHQAAVLQKFSVKLSGALWSGCTVDTPQYDIESSRSRPEDAKAKAKKGTEKEKAETQAAPPVDEAPLKHQVVFAIPQIPSAARDLLRSFSLDATVTDTLSDDSSHSFSAGDFALDLSPLLTAASVNFSVALCPDELLCQERARELGIMKEALDAMSRNDQELDRQLAEVAGSPPEGAVSPRQPPPPKKADKAAPKKEVAGRIGGPTSAVSDETLRLQQESSVRKTEIEEFTARLHVEEANLSRIIGAQVTLKGIAQAVGAAIRVYFPGMHHDVVARLPSPSAHRYLDSLYFCFFGEQSVLFLETRIT